MRYKLQNYLKIVVLVLLTACSLVAQSAEQNQARKEFDLSGWWKADKIRPGQGMKEQYHKLPLWHHTTEDWMNAKIPGDIYTDLWRAGAIIKILSEEDTHGFDALRKLLGPEPKQRKKAKGG